MFGTSHCCYSSSSCFSDTSELVLTLAGAERQTHIFECAVHALCSASDVTRTDAPAEDTPNQCERDTAYTRRSDRTFQAYAIGCREGNIKEDRVYTLVRNPGVHNNRISFTIGSIYLCTLYVTLFYTRGYPRTVHL